METNWDKPVGKKKIDRFAIDPHSHEKEQNKRLDKSLGGTPIIGSGKFEGAKGDRELDGLFKIEEKATRAQSIAITRKFLEKIFNEALQQNKEPALAFSFLSGKSPAPSDWIAVPVTLFREMYVAWKEKTQ